MSRITECAIKIATAANKMSYHLTDEEAIELCEELETRIRRAKINAMQKLKFRSKRK